MDVIMNGIFRKSKGNNYKNNQKLKSIIVIIVII